MAVDCIGDCGVTMVVEVGFLGGVVDGVVAVA